MRASYAVWVLLPSLASIGCSDEKEGAGVGPDTSWQVFCVARNGTTCPRSLDPHGPLDTNGDKQTDHPITARCSRSTSGLSLTLADPGQSDPAKMLRKKSQVLVTRVNLEENKCLVRIDEEDPVTNALLTLEDTCTGNGQEGTCTLAGEQDSEAGYAVEATLICTGMRYQDQGPRDFILRAARTVSAQPSPVVLQIANCD